MGCSVSQPRNEIEPAQINSKKALYESGTNDYYEKLEDTDVGGYGTGGGGVLHKEQGGGGEAEADNNETISDSEDILTTIFKPKISNYELITPKPLEENVPTVISTKPGEMPGFLKPTASHLLKLEQEEVKKSPKPITNKTHKRQRSKAANGLPNFMQPTSSQILKTNRTASGPRSLRMSKMKSMPQLSPSIKATHQRKKSTRSRSRSKSLAVPDSDDVNISPRRRVLKSSKTSSQLM